MAPPCLNRMFVPIGPLLFRLLCGIPNQPAEYRHRGATRLPASTVWRRGGSSVVALIEQPDHSCVGCRELEEPLFFCSEECVRDYFNGKE